MSVNPAGSMDDAQNQNILNQIKNSKNKKQKKMSSVLQNNIDGNNNKDKINQKQVSDQIQKLDAKVFEALSSNSPKMIKPSKPQNLNIKQIDFDNLSNDDFYKNDFDINQFKIKKQTREPLQKPQFKPMNNPQKQTQAFNEQRNQDEDESIAAEKKIHSENINTRNNSNVRIQNNNMMKAGFPVQNFGKIDNGFQINQPRTTQQEVTMKINEISKLNKQAMQNFKLGEKEIAQKFLQSAEKMSESLKQIWYFKQKELGDMLGNNYVCKAFTTTYNNLGVFHKSSGKTNLAIKYLKQVLEIEQEMTNSDSKEQDIASTFVNICSIYSEMGKHDIALTYIKRAVDYLDEAYEHKLQSLVDLKEKRQFIQIVATAFHNAGVEFEFLKSYEKCLTYYQKSFSICLQHLGGQHPLTQTFEASLIGAQKKIDAIPPQQRVFNERSQITIQSKKKKSARSQNSRGKTQRSQVIQQKLKQINQEVSLSQMSPQSLSTHHKGELYGLQSNRNNNRQSNKSVSNIAKPLPYIKSSEQMKNIRHLNANLEIQKAMNLNLRSNNFMSERSITRSNQGVYQDQSSQNDYTTRDKDRQEYFSIRDILEQSRIEIKEEIEKYANSQILNLSRQGAAQLNMNSSSIKASNAYDLLIPKSSNSNSNIANRLQSQQNALNIKQVYSTIQRPVSKIQKQKIKSSANNTLDLILQNQPSNLNYIQLKNREEHLLKERQQNLTLDYIDTSNNKSSIMNMKKPPRQYKINDDLSAYLTNYRSQDRVELNNNFQSINQNKNEDIQKAISNTALQKMVDNDLLKKKRQENIQQINRNRLRNLQDSSSVGKNVNNNIGNYSTQEKEIISINESGRRDQKYQMMGVENGEQGGQTEQDQRSISNNKSRYLEFKEDTASHILVPALHEKKIQSSCAHQSAQDLRQDIEDQLEDKINSLQLDLDLKFQHPRQQSKVLSKIEYINQLEPSLVKKLQNAAITFKHQLKSKLYHAHFMRCYLTKTTAFKYITLYNKIMKSTLIQIFKQCAETRAQHRVFTEKRQLIRQKDEILNQIETLKQNNSARSSPGQILINNSKALQIKGLIDKSSLYQESSKKQSTLKLNSPYELDFGNNSALSNQNQINSSPYHNIMKSSESQQNSVALLNQQDEGDLMSDSFDQYKAPIILSQPDDEMQQISIINSRARRQKVMEQLKNKNPIENQKQTKNNLTNRDFAQFQDQNPRQPAVYLHLKHNYERSSRSLQPNAYIQQSQEQFKNILNKEKLQPTFQKSSSITDSYISYNPQNAQNFKSSPQNYQNYPNMKMYNQSETFAVDYSQDFQPKHQIQFPQNDHQIQVKGVQEITSILQQSKLNEETIIRFQPSDLTLNQQNIRSRIKRYNLLNQQ